jgi:DNA-binding NarL/FixJ family response regulator
MPRILIADDHGLYRRGIRMAVTSMIPGADVAEADSLDSLLTRLAEFELVDLALVDLYMDGPLSRHLIQEMRANYPQTRFAIISASGAIKDILRALEMGLHGYISKHQSDTEIIAAINDILSGRIYVPPMIAARKPECASPDTHIVNEDSISASRIEFHKLTARQRDVLNLLAEGRSNKEIARALNIAEATTKIHVAASMRALGVRNRTEAAVRTRTWLNEQR